MSRHIFGYVATLVLASLASTLNAQLLGTADSFAVLAGSTATSTGPTTLYGDIGVWPGTSITGFPPGVVIDGSMHLGDETARIAEEDLGTAYDAIASEAPTMNLTGQNLGGMTLLPGVYRFDSEADLTGKLTLDAQGDPDARFDFQIGSTLISASNAVLDLVNEAEGCNVYWQVGSSATLGTDTSLSGHIMAMASITLNRGASIVYGSALARTGAVTMDSNTIAACPVPEPASLIAIASGVSFMAARRRRQKC